MNKFCIVIENKLSVLKQIESLFWYLFLKEDHLIMLICMHLLDIMLYILKKR